MIDQLVITQFLHTLQTANPVITNITVGVFGDSSTVTVLPASAQASVQSVIDNFNWSQSAAQARDDAANPARTALRLAAAGFISDINAYQAIPNPSVADIRTFTKELGQMNKLIITRLIEINSNL